MKTGVILAAGNAERFRGKVKQLLKIDKETLLERQIRQFSQHCEPIYLMTHQTPYMMPCKRVIRRVPALRRWKCETLLSSAEWWGAHALIWHGDVMFTEAAAQLIGTCQCDVPTFFWDGSHETFALWVPPETKETILRVARKIVDSTINNVVPASDNTCGLSNLAAACEAMKVPIERVMIRDGTQDFDSPQEYANWLHGYKKYTGDIIPPPEP